MPVALLRMYQEMLPVLQAEEAMRDLNTNFYGSGWAKGEDVGAFIDELRAPLGPRTPRKLPRPEQMIGRLASMGVKVAR